MASEAEMSSSGVLSSGDRVGSYRLLEPLGRGGVALVFRALDESSGRFVAFKTAHAPREGLLASIRREIGTLERIHHPGVVRILEGGVFEGRPWYTMELLEGQTLQDHLQHHLTSRGSETTEESSSMMDRLPLDSLTSVGGLAIKAAPASPAVPIGSVRRPALGGDIGWFLTMIRRLCEPLAFIHGEGLVHRDLKPGNVFVRADGTPILMDFGLVWRLQEEASREVLSVDAARAGTIAYMAPEQARGERVDPRGDLFSLGCIMYEALTGGLPYVARSVGELIAAHGGPAPPAPSRTTDGVDPSLDDLVMGLLQQHPRDRIGHARDVAAALADMGAKAWPTTEMAPAKSYLYQPQLVGRGPILDQALSYVSHVLEGGGCCVLIGGVSGIGKTSLASEVARLASHRGIRVVTGECAAVGVAEGRGLRRAGPLYPFGPLLHAVADRCVSDGLEGTARILGGRGKILATVEPSLRDLPGVASLPEPPDVPGEAARRRLIDALAETLSAFTADQPTLLVFDDLQWADDLTLAFLASLSEHYFATNPISILGTFRSEEKGVDLDRVTSLLHVFNLALDHLDTEAIGAMAADMLGQSHVSEKLAAFLAVESSGNPFFAAEYLRAAVDAGLLFRDGRGHWLQADGGIALERLDLPRTIQALVSRRLDSLADPARRLAQVAAVLGREVEIDVLSALAIDVGEAPDEAHFDESLRALVVRQVFEATSLGSVRFVHDKLREVAYEGLTLDRQRTLHSASGALLERRHSNAGTLERVFATLAHHFEKAGEDEAALSYLDKAGEAAHGMYANHEALRLLEKAKAMEQKAAIATPALARARRERLLGLNALAVGNVNAAFKSLTEAVGVAGKPWPRSRFRLLVRVLFALGCEVMRRWLPRFGARNPQTTTERDLLLEAARAYERLMVVTYFSTADMLAVALCAATNMALAEEAGGVSGERALGYATFGAMCAFVPLDSVAQSYCRRAVQVARESAEEVAETWVLMNVGMVHLLAGRWAEMRECQERVRTLAHRIGFSRRWEESTTQFSTGCFLGGRFEEAEQLNVELLGAIERADPQSKCWAIVRRAELCLAHGDVAGALVASEEGERWCQQGLGRPEWIYTLGPLALARLRSGDTARAREAADRCLEWIRKGSAPVFYNIFAHSALAEVYLALLLQAGDPADRRVLLASSRYLTKQLRAIGRAMAVAAPRALLWRGMRALLVEGRAVRAVRLFRESLERARKLDMPYDEAMAIAAIGEHAGVLVPDAGQYLTQAANIFQRIGATHDLRRVEQLQGALNQL